MWLRSWFIVVHLVLFFRTCTKYASLVEKTLSMLHVAEPKSIKYLTGFAFMAACLVPILLVRLVVLCFMVLKIMTIFLSHTPKLSSRLSSERHTLWRHFWSYCRVTKSLPSLFCYARWSSSWKWRETSCTFFAHGDPLSDWTKWQPARSRHGWVHIVHDTLPPTKPPTSYHQFGQDLTYK